MISLHLPPSKRISNRGNIMTNFIKATHEYNTFEAPVPAYCFRRAIVAEDGQKLRLTIAVCGFYELYWNGNRITRGFLSPYISNPEDYVYADEYEVTAEDGENVIGVLLGNGFQNNPGGYIWDFDKANFRSAPLFSLTLCDGEGAVLAESDTSFKTHPSAIRSDDYRFGEHYDATCEIPGWNCPGFDDSAWGQALPADLPKGEIRVADVSPITCEREIRPVSITRSGDGYIYDFGEINAGVCRLRVCGERGQKIELRHDEVLQDGDLLKSSVWFKRDPQLWERDKDIVHCDTYVCKGEGEEIYQPTFTYHGFRYVRVDGITEAQATPELLTYLVYHTDLQERGDFTCSDEVANGVQQITRQSILSNFHHYPTDCPQREKNGWTADAALSSEAALLNFNPERNYREWMRNICKAQSEAGSLPGIIPTGGWGFHWGNGPAWDCVLVYLPYFTYIYRGETDMITESAESFVAYLNYLRTRADDQGLMHIGLGDWCITGVKSECAPLEVTDTVMCVDIATKMAVLFDAVGMAEEAEFARGEAARYRAAARAHLIDFDTMMALGRCQTSQAMCLFYGVFEESEKAAAFEGLLHLIAECDDRLDLGVLGGRVILHVLDEFGYADLAWKMAVTGGYPSYGDLVRRGATTLWESFYPEDAHWGPPSFNHHFWGDVSAWFIKSVAGIRMKRVNTVEIRPAFIGALDHASAYHHAPAGKVAVSWKRDGDGVILNLEMPEGVDGTVVLRDGYAFADGATEMTAGSGVYRIMRA